MRKLEDVKVRVRLRLRVLLLRWLYSYSSKQINAPSGGSSFKRLQASLPGLRPLLNHR